MADDTKKYIKKIKLSDGSVHYLYDTGAARAEQLGNYLPLTGGSLTGNLQVGDTLIANTDGSFSVGTVTVTSIELESNSPSYVVTTDDTGELKKRSTDVLLEDIGGCSYVMDTTNGILKLKTGKQ